MNKTNKFNLTAIAAASLAIGITGDAAAKNNQPSDPLPEVQDLSCVYESTTNEGFLDYFSAEFHWDDTIDAGEAETATNYGGVLGIEVVYTGECVLEGEVDTFGPIPRRQVDIDIDLDDTDYGCNGEECWGEFYGESAVDALNDAVDDDADAFCEAWMTGAVANRTYPYTDDVEQTMKHLEPGNGRQNHPVVTFDCYEED